MPAALASILLCMAMLLVIMPSSGCSSQIPKPVSIVKPGDPAPDFSLQAVRGGMYGLNDLHGQPMLLSFINTRADAASTTSDPSRAQIVFLKSMQQQYGADGLKVMILDAARQVTGKQSSLDELINFTYDWQLDSIPVLIDNGAEAVARYGVSTVPSTFLIGPDGVIRQRWNGIATSSQLALSITTLISAPENRSAGTATSCPGEARPQAKFAGLGLARSLSDEIWAVDNGKSWGVGGAFPLEWIIIDSQDKLGAAGVHLQVTARYLDSRDDIVLVDQDLSPLPVDEARGLLVPSNRNAPKVYFLVTSINLYRSGCLQLKAVVFAGANLVYEGWAAIATDLPH